MSLRLNTLMFSGLALIAAQAIHPLHLSAADAADAKPAPVSAVPVDASVDASADVSDESVTAVEGAELNTAEDVAKAAAAQKLFMAMKLEQTFGKTITNMVELQVTQQPEIAPFKQVMLDFFDKYMSWDSMKDEMGKIYTDEFSIDEIKELTKFYSSPVGEKAATRMPELMNKAANLGAQRVQKHMGELQQMIQAEAQKAQLQNGASPSPK